VLKALLESVAGNLRFCYKATPAQKTRWGTTTVAGFYRPEHAQAALKWLSGMPGMQGQQLYTVYFTVSEDLASAIIVDVENTVFRMDVDLVRETPRQGNVTLRLTGIRRDVVADVKKTLEAAFLGSVAAQSGDASHQTTHREIWHDFFATVPGYIWLQHLGHKVGCWSRAISSNSASGSTVLAAKLHVCAVSKNIWPQNPRSLILPDILRSSSVSQSLSELSYLLAPWSSFTKGLETAKSA
jgi:hypothetical protein